VLGVELEYEGAAYRVTVKYNPRTGQLRVNSPGCGRVAREDLIKFALDAYGDPRQ
jgi:hypothetical protein